MSENIFNEADCHRIRLRIQELSSHDIGLWGVMSINQMLEHCAIQLKLALGMLPQGKPESTFLYRTAVGRWLSLYVIPWPKGFETPAIMNMTTNNMPVGDFDSERKLLLSLLSHVVEQNQLSPHPFYGAIELEDWGRLIWVHLNHHLRQFGK